MLEILNNWILVLDKVSLQIMDPVLGWLLHLHRDVAMVMVASATAFVMVVVRKWVTDQNWLGRAHHDQARLDELVKIAKKAKDKEALARYKQTKNLIQMRSSKFELKPLLVVIVPVILLVTWCFGRFGFEPPRDGETVRVKLSVAKSDIGSLVHLAPVEGLSVKNGWVRTVEKDVVAKPEAIWDQCNAWLVDKVSRLFAWMTRMPPADPDALLEGAAIWEVAGKSRTSPYPLNIVMDGRNYEAKLLVGQKRYSPELVLFSDGKVQSVSLLMRTRRPFGFIGALDWLLCPPWLVAYMLIAMPLFFLFKRILKVY
jgi:uncharacterized membrane protein (DUF106 family)